MNEITAIGSCVEIVVPITPVDGFERNSLANAYIIIVSNAREVYLFFRKEMREVFYF